MGKSIQSKRNLGIDLLKAILAIMILCRHAALLSIFPNQDALWMQAAPMTKFVYFSIQGMCVPLFMVVSLFFYVKKRAKDKSYFKKRLGRLAQIICFWWPIYFILTQTTEFPLVPDNALGAILIPFLNGSMYFLGGIVFSVLCIELIEKIIEILPEKYTNFVLLTSLLISFLGTIILRDVIPHNSALSSQLIGLGPLTFLEYPAIMALFGRWQKGKSISLMLLVGALFQLLEYGLNVPQLKNGSINILGLIQLDYGSPIVAPLALIIVIWFVSLKIEKLPAFVKWTATHALGIYLIHPIIIALLNKVTHNQFLFVHSKSLILQSGSISVNIFGTFMVLIISIGIVYGISKSPLKRFVC